MAVGVGQAAGALQPRAAVGVGQVVLVGMASLLGRQMAARQEPAAARAAPVPQTTLVEAALVAPVPATEVQPNGVAVLGVVELLGVALGLVVEAQFSAPVAAVRAAE